MPSDTCIETCPMGYYDTQTPVSGSQGPPYVCKECGVGNYCRGPTGISPNLSSTETPCPTGSYCAAGTGSPAPCPSGSYCPPGDARAPRTCPSESYCVAGTGAPAPCPSGRSAIGTKSLSECGCPPGQYKPTTGGTCTGCAEIVGKAYTTAMSSCIGSELTAWHPASSKQSLFLVGTATVGSEGTTASTCGPLPQSTMLADPAMVDHAFPAGAPAGPGGMVRFVRSDIYGGGGRTPRRFVTPHRVRTPTYYRSPCSGQSLRRAPRGGRCGGMGTGDMPGSPNRKLLRWTVGTVESLWE